MASVDQLDFEVILSDTNFNKQIKEDLEMAQKFNIQVSEYLDLRKKYEGISAAQARAVKTAAQVAGQEAVFEQRVATERERTAAATARAEAAQVRLNRARQQGVNGQNSILAALRNSNDQFTLQNRLISNATTLFTSYVSVFAVERFVTSLARVRGEFELQQVALQAIMQDVDAADKTFSQLKGLAVESPFQFKELAGYAKQLSAYNIANEDLFDSLKRIADLSAGVGVSMDRLILAYGQVRSAEFLRGQEIRQFSEAGINLVGELADRFSKLEGRVVSAGEVFDRVSKRMVSFEMVKEVIDDLTNEGGRFFDQQRVQAQTLAGQLSNLTDAYEIMLNELGEANDGVLKGGVSAIRSMFENWEKVVSVLKTVVAGYLTFKSVSAIEKAITSVGGLEKYLHSAGVRAEHLGRTLKTAFASNPWTIALTALVSIGTAIYGAYQNSQKLNREIEKLLSENISRLKDDISLFNDLAKSVLSAAEGTTAHEKALSALMSRFGDYLPGLSEAKDKNEKLRASIEGVTTAMKNQAYANAEAQAREKVLGEHGDDISNAGVKIEKQLRSLFDNLGPREAAKLATIIQEKLKNAIEEGFDIRSNWKDLLKRLENEIPEIRFDFRNVYKNSESNTLIPFLQHYALEYKSYTDDLNTQLERVAGTYAAFGADVNATNEQLAKANEIIAEYDAKIADAASSDKLDLIREKYAKLKEVLGGTPDWRKYETELTNLLPATEDFAGRFNAIVNGIQGVDEAVKNSYLIKGGQSYKDAITKYNAEYESLAKNIQELEGQLTGLKMNPVDNKALILSTEKELAETKKRLVDLQKILLSTNTLDNKAWKSEVKSDTKAEAAAQKEAKRVAKIAIQTLRAELEKYKKNFNFYEELMGMGVDKDRAVSLSFGSTFQGDPNLLDEYVDGLRDAISKRLNRPIALSTNILDVASIQDQLKSIWVELTDEERKLALETDAIAEDMFRSLIQKLLRYSEEQAAVQDKIKAQQEKTKNELAALESSELFKGLPKEEQERAYKAIVENGRRAIAELESESYKLSGFYQQLFGNLDAYSVRSLQKLLDYAKKIREQMQTPEKQSQLKEQGFVEVGIDGEQIRLTERDIASLIKKIAELQNIVAQKNPFKALGESAKNARAAQEKVSNALSEYGKDSEEYQAALREAGMANDQFASDAAKVAFVVGAGFSELAGIVQALGLDADGTFSTILNGFASIASGAGSIAMGIASGNPMDFISGIGSVITGIASLFGSTTKEMEKLQERSQQVLNQLQWEFDNVAAKIGKAINTDAIWERMWRGTISQPRTPFSFTTGNRAKTLRDDASAANELKKAVLDLDYAFGKDIGPEKYKATGEQLDNLAEQYKEVGIQMEAEHGKRKKDQDPAKIEEYKQQMAEIAGQMKEIIDSTVEDIFGGSATDLASRLGDALVNAFRNGEDAAEAWHNTVEDMISDIVKKLLISKLLEEPIAALMTKYTKKWFEVDEKAGKVSIATIDQMLEDAQGIQDGLNSLYPQIAEAMKAIYDQMDLTAKETTPDSLQQGIEGVTEETANILAGYLNAIRQEQSIQGFRMAQMHMLLTQGNTIANMHTYYLQQIAANTYNNSVTAVQISRDTANIVSKLDSVISTRVGGAGKAINVNA